MASMNGNCNKIREGCYIYIILSYIICTGFKYWEQRLGQLLQFSRCVKVVYFIESISCLLIININIFTNSNRQELEILNLCISTCVHLHKIYQKNPQIQRYKINKNCCDIMGNDCLIAQSVKWCRVHFFDPHYMCSVMS